MYNILLFMLMGQWGKVR